VGGTKDREVGAQLGVLVEAEDGDRMRSEAFAKRLADDDRGRLLWQNHSLIYLDARRPSGLARRPERLGARGDLRRGQRP
jgi:hypothetical protein